MMTSCNDNAVTGFDLVVMVFTIKVIAGFLIVSLEGERDSGDSGGPRGIIHHSVTVHGANIHQIGSIIGVPAIDTMQNKVLVRFPRPNRDRPGGVRMYVSLFIGDTDGIDMDRVTVLWMTNDSVSAITQNQVQHLICPNWTITVKCNLLPGHEANADNILDPYERFDLFICPEAGVAPYQQFTVAITPPGAALPLPVRITVPGRIQPIMVLN
jgi:hypothetical protein